MITNAELMSKVLDDVRRGRAPRLHGPDDHTATAVPDADWAALTTQTRRPRACGSGWGSSLSARCAGLSTEELATSVSAYIEHHGEVVVDAEMSVGDLLDARIQVSPALLTSPRCADLTQRP